VTTLSPGIRVLNKSRLGDTEVEAGANGSVYAYNTNISYVGTYLNAATDVSDWMQHLVSGLNLRLSDQFSYTPEPPAFITGGKIPESDLLARGVQGYRSNTFSNNVAADASYSISRSVALKTGYSYSVRRTGNIFVPGQPFTFFDTNAHNVATGPTYTFSGGDSLFIKYNYLNSDQTPTTGVGPSFTFTAHSIQPEYAATIVRGWKTTISGGATLLEEANNKTFFSGKFTLLNDFDRRTRVSISVSRQPSPAYFGTGGALISNVAQVYLSHNLTRVIILSISANYAHNETASEPVFKIETIYGSAALDYKLTRTTKLSLSQEYNHISFTGSPDFDRHATMLTLTTEWK
jgi:hypothetical protein